MTKANDKSAKLTPDLLTKKRPRGRPPKPDALTNSQRQARYRKRRLPMAVGERMTETVQTLAKDFDLTTSEVTAHLVRFALCNRNWKQTGFPD